MGSIAERQLRLLVVLTDLSCNAKSLTWTGRIQLSATFHPKQVYTRIFCSRFEFGYFVLCCLGFLHFGWQVTRGGLQNRFRFPCGRSDVLPTHRRQTGIVTQQLVYLTFAALHMLRRSGCLPTKVSHDKRQTHQSRAVACHRCLTALRFHPCPHQDCLWRLSEPKTQFLL